MGSSMRRTAATSTAADLLASLAETRDGDTDG
jgi:hypothetical protein